MNSTFKEFDTKALCRGPDYSVGEILRRANTDCLSSDPEARVRGSNVLFDQYNDNTEEMLYFHQAKCLSLMCIHGHGNAKEEFKALNLDADKAGIDCISLCQDVKRWERMNEQSFQPFYDLANETFNALKQSKELLDEELQKYFKVRDEKLDAQAKAEGEEDEENMDTDTEGTEYKSEPESGQEEDEEAVRKNLQVAKIKSLPVIGDTIEFEVDFKGSDSKGKSIILLMQDHSDTVKCLDLLNNYLQKQKGVRKAARRTAWEEARKEKKYRAILSKEKSEQELQEGERDVYGDEQELEEGNDDEYVDEELDEDDEEFEEVPQHGTKRGREEFEDDLSVDFSQPIALRYKKLNV